MKKRVLLAAAAAGVFCLTSVAFAVTAHRPGARPHLGKWGFDLSGRDPSVRPGDDFYEYANGAAVKKLVIPPDRSRFGSFDVLTELSETRVHGLLEAAAAHPAASPTTDDQKIGAFYKAFMDEAGVEALGAKPLQPDLVAVRAASTPQELIALMGRSPKSFMFSLFDVSISPDAKDPNRYAVNLDAGGLGLPDRDYYLTPQFAEQKAKYQAYVAQMLDLAGWPDAKAQAKDIVAFETKIAEAHWPRADLRDPVKTYNPMTVEELERAAPGFAWRTLLTNADLSGVDRVIVSANTALPKMVAIFGQTPMQTLKAWEAFHIVDSAAPYLSSPFVEARFEFRSKTLAGQPQQRARWKRAVAAVSDGMGEAIGRVYVARYFPPASKAKMEQLVGDLKAAFHARIEKLDWMSPETKARALDKLAKYTVQIGYPRKWRDYSGLAIRTNDLYGDVERGIAWDWAFRVGRLNKPVDKDEWEMTPQTVNAYNEPVFNEVVFPAAILQPPFFDPNADPAVNYGAIGGVIGHEMTHGFDDQGRQFDAEGRLRDWWTPGDAERFKAKADRLGAQYSAIEPLPGAHINGQLTMGENIADLGGLNLALDAYHASLHGRRAPVLNGLTGDQRVFLGWAQVWREKIRPEQLRQRLVTDPHSPGRARVNAVVHNVDGWYPAYKVTPGEKLYLAPAERVHIW